MEETNLVLPVYLFGWSHKPIVTRSTVSVQFYRGDILDPIVRPYAGAVGDSFILQDDNARPYRARLVENYLREESIVYIGWPVRYPYLNPIEHVWYSLGKRISPLNPLATTLQGLGTALTQQWTLLPINKQHHSEHGILCPSCIAIRGLSHSILKLIMH
ncbi:hypothetical protein AVEN_104874-1 [Araneus ventricosus]|uniref:Tc1-like transposase DDE domain-containing protein n=1 Tax=Araneus ventricosus TaxID=182803 RepID=A0A4Y2QHL0_ARAVE|nr:hypothetical protein AVEN_104874-1 [Araneus ventricosus]